MKNLKITINNIFKIKNITITLIVIGFSQSLRYLFFYTFGVPLPGLFKDPLHLYRLLYLIIIKGFTMILHKIWNKIF